jgi:hypothetical protein
LYSDQNGRWKKKKKQNLGVTLKLDVALAVEEVVGDEHRGNNIEKGVAEEDRVLDQHEHMRCKDDANANVVQDEMRIGYLLVSHVYISSTKLAGGNLGS